MAIRPPPGMIAFHMPQNRRLLAAVGAVTLAHSHLDHVLKMTVKTLSGVSPAEAMLATAFQGSKVLRERIAKLARQKFGEGPVLMKLQALLERCRLITDARITMVHSLRARGDKGKAFNLDGGRRRKAPSAKELEALNLAIQLLALELNHARLYGFLAAALRKNS